MKIAITGSSGFLGRAVIRKLQENKIAYTELKSNLPSDNLKDFVEGKDIIIHLAAVNRGENTNILEVNTLGTISLLEAAAKYAPTSRIIFASSFQIYLSKSFYGLSKKLAEEQITAYTKRSSLKGTVLRISNIYGPGGKPFYNSAIATFVHLIKEDESIVINGDGLQKRDFIYVDDVAQAITKAVLYNQNESLEVIDICSGKESSLNDILKTLEEVSGKRIKVVYNKVNKEDNWPTQGKDFLKAKKLLGWQPKTQLREGLSKML